MTLTATDAVLAFDREHLWHPYTSMTAPTPAHLVTAARGCELEVDGAWVVDGMASWWSAIHGYRHPALDAALTEQAGRFSHVMFGGLTHEPAVGLGRRLVEITPEPLERVFLADSGSVSVEVAMKMVLQYQRGRGRPERTRMLTVLGGYHGDTFDCMSVTDPVGGMHSMWAGLLPDQIFGPQPPSYDAGAPELATWAAGLRSLAARHAHELAGIIVEPLLQGAGGMHPYPAECLQVFREIADEHGLLLVFDEIATGFGRTGHLFVSELVTPDVLCLGKALTGGYLTLAAVITTDEVARGISASESGVVMHGPTFMGNPLACAVASASIDLLLDGDWAGRVRAIGDRLAAGLSPLRGTPGVRDVRTIGAVGVVQLDHPVDVIAATEAALAAGAWLRPFRDLVYAMPPYVTGPDELDRLLAGITAAVRAG
ncbi:adenosylmethionine--8-amino-7-oxononanoate transaminase [Pimelobacter simplex]|uniref:Adenosylmethionine-8-amino-7-oxononanoate aminotransferase n=2 Tax=Nocardioides simplex TaxID=2045 RepID=A0A0A1DLJ4_NOCSI|nr:adenosylmethionine--8-amino-7-oxononanoate transaminase [Pimelobacter simplex]AIY18291.1 Adenosylmethionine-8-amino-7-oxononanoate aminotransferase [Pimelobacter simplex]GEB15925.1 adenosylmethionine--8-amino-7-oxononanoate aminotransferase BioA [Pimelobacter simplex]SFN12845.1 adenosylmethionine-8-amino-7-oxononanoate aminotransferase [Pimelobacter simplex]